MTIRWANFALTALLLATAAPCAAFAKSSACAERDAPRCDDRADEAVKAQLEIVQNSEGKAQIEAAMALVDTVAANLDTVSSAVRSDLDTGLWIYFQNAGRERGGADFEQVIARMRGFANQARIAKQYEVELFFLDWMNYGVSGDARLGHARLIHRRAVDYGLLTSDAAAGARSTMVVYGDSLLAEGRYDELVRALDDTFAELDDAGLRTVSQSLLLRYAEALTLARRDADADRAFDDLIALLRVAPVGRYESRAGEIQRANNQISYYRNIAGRFAASETPGRFAATESERLIGREHINTQKARYNFAVALLGMGKAAEALPYFEEALPLQLAIEEDRWSDRKTDTIILLTTLARARAQVKGRESDALAAAIDAADRLRAKRDAGLTSADKANPAVAALAKAVARGTRRNPQSGAFDMVMFAGWAARATESDALGTAFLAAQDLTLTDAGDAINQAAARDIAGTGPLGDLVRERQDVVKAVVSLTQRYRQKSIGKDEARTAAIGAELDAATARLAPLDARIATEFPDYATLIAPKAINVAAVQALLARDEAVLMLLPSEGHHYAFAISKAKALWHRVDEGAALVAADVARLKCRIDEATCTLPEFNAMLDAEARGGKSPIDERYPRYDRAAAHRLYDRLLAPILAALPKNGRVYTVASGPIAGLPLAALVAKPPKGDPESGAVDDLTTTDWLARHYRFITLPSVSALALARRDSSADAASRPELVGYGAPTLLGSGSAEARGTDGRPRKRGGIAVRGGGFTLANGDKTVASVEKLRRLDPLPGTVTELTRLAAVIAHGGGLRLGADATESAVKADTELPRAVAVVFATHGLLPGEMGTGSEPGLVLTPPGTASDNDDGLLTATEAATLVLSAKWVVLSACNTATPGVEAGASGESLSSLARSFLYAGADNLLASHWRVADDATAALTVEALANRSATPATALAHAMEAVRTGRRIDGSSVDGWQPHWAHPASWAPFTLVTNRDR